MSVKAAVEAACAGLTMPSETDAGFAFVAGGAVKAPITPAAIRAELGAQHDALIGGVLKSAPGEGTLAQKSETEVLEAGAFFAHLVGAADPNDAWSTDRAARLSALLAVLRTHLKDLVVVRFGAVTISTFIVGRTTEGTLAGVLTGQVET